MSSPVRTVPVRPELSALLACPSCHRPFRISAEVLECRRCTIAAKTIDGAIVIASSQSRAGYFNPPHPSTMLRPPDAIELIGFHAQGVVLEIGAADQTVSYPHLVRLDQHRYVGTDIVVEDLESLPFQDESFDCVIALSSVEHVRDPFRHLRELARVLRSRGALLLDASFLQPAHQTPHHYFNFTKHGLEQLLEGFQIHSIAPSPTQQPWYALMWHISEFIEKLEDGESRASAQALTLGEVAQRFLELKLRAESFSKANGEPSLLSNWWSKVNIDQRDLIAPLHAVSPNSTADLAAGFRVLALKNGDKKPTFRGKPDTPPIRSITSLFDAFRGNRAEVNFGERIVLQQNEFSGHCGEIWGERVISQTFEHAGSVCRIDLMFANFMRQNDRDLLFRLNSGNGSLLLERTINCREIRDNEYFAITFPSIHATDGRYRIELTSPTSYLNNSVTVRTSSAKRLAGTVFSVNGTPHERDLTFRVFSHDDDSGRGCS